MKKTLITILATVLVCACVVGGTLAWLTDKTDTVTNTFTIGDVSITLVETVDDEFKIIPGATYKKDPTVAVVAGSEACYLYVKVEKANNVDDFIDYTINADWTALDGVDGVYFINVNADTAEAGKSYTVLTGNTVTVKDSITTGDMPNADALPTLSFTAYAIQSANTGTAAEAWAKIPA